MDKIAFARHLRRQQTKAEARLWGLLRTSIYKFRRQVPRGPYVLDFVCLEHRLVVEVDGGQHGGSAYDVERDAWLAARGFRVLRVWNPEVLGNLGGVWELIVASLESPLTPPGGDPLPRRGE